MTWHVQIAGSGPVALLLHGTGASTHSWRDSVNLLSKSFTVVIPDLPGHAFSQPTSEYSLTLDGMARAVAGLIDELDLQPDFVVGHSAGAAVAIRMAIDKRINPKALVSLNGALLPFPGVASVMFPILAKILFLNPVSLPIAARLASDPDNVRGMIERTGTHLSSEALAYYTRLFQDRGHVSAAINMMARWDLHALRRDLHKLELPLLVVSGEHDLAVPLWVADSVQERVSHARAVVMKNCGHLAHEEHPEQVCKMLLDYAADCDVIQT